MAHGDDIEHSEESENLLDSLYLLRDTGKQINKERPSPADLEKIQQICRSYPAIRSSLAGTIYGIQEQLTGYYSGQASKEAVRIEMAELRRSLGYYEADPLEQLLIEDVVTSYISKCVIEMELHKKMCAGVSFAHGAYLNKSVASAQRRMHRAITTLVRVRRANLPALMVNIGANQINMR